jgi:alcohol dehydrogenase
MNSFDFLSAKMYEFRVPPTLHFGPGCLGKVSGEAARFGKKALLVTDLQMQKAGFVSSAVNYLQAGGIEAAVYDGVNYEPTDKLIEEGLRIYRENGCEMVISLGGGSPIDAGKAIAAVATNPGRIHDYMGANKIPNPPAPIISIPTTAGTGSEVTRVTIITDTANDVKMLIMSSLLMPQVAIVDPLLTLSMPPWVTASTGVDALTHAIEAYISKRAQPFTDVLALEAIRLMGKYLRRSWANSEDIEAKTYAMMASTLGGISFSNSSVALVHGMSRPIGACFHVPHGLSNAVLLPVVMEYNKMACPEKFARIAEAMGENVEGLPVAAAAQKAVDAVRQLCADLKIPHITKLKVTPEELMRLAPKMAEDAIISGSPGNNPRQAGKEEIVELYKQLLIVA